MPVKLNSTGGGSITLDAPSTASAFTLTIPAITGTIISSDSGGNVGINATPTSGKLDVRGFNGTGFFLSGSSGSYQGMALSSSDASGSAYRGLFIDARNESGSAVANILCDVNTDGSSSWAFSTQPSGTRTDRRAERMRIDSSGNFMVGTGSSTVAGKNAKITAYQTASAPAITSYSNTTVNTNQIIFVNPNGEVGTINTSGTTTSYSTSSDYRLKHNVQPMLSGLSTIAALKPSTYKWNADNSYGEGFIAHELAEHIPHAVTGEKDATNEDGSIKPQGVDYSKIVVHLVAAIQELKAEFDAYKAAHP